MLKKGILSALHRCGIMPAVRSLFAGPGAILMFHEIHRDVDNELRTGVAEDFLDFLIPWIRSAGWDIVSMDEGARRLSSYPDKQSRFVVLTFDDGYRDNLVYGLPILERHNAPFTVYVPTGAIDRTLECWWLGLRELVRKRDVVEIDSMGVSFQCPSFDSKVAALASACDWIHQDYARTSGLTSLFRKHGISLRELNESYFLDESQLRRLARHPLVTIGGHTVSHPALSLLAEDMVYRELTDNRRYLEGLLDRPISHFAYPYGNGGDREAEIAAKAGFETAVTTQNMPILHLSSQKHALPRLGMTADTTPANLDAKISGLRDALLRLRAPLRRDRH